MPLTYLVSYCRSPVPYDFAISNPVFTIGDMDICMSSRVLPSFLRKREPRCEQFRSRPLQMRRKFGLLGIVIMAPVQVLYANDSGMILRKLRHAREPSDLASRELAGGSDYAIEWCLGSGCRMGPS